MPYNVHSDSFMSGREKICPICGKHFWATTEWAYQKNGKVYCSWHCRQTLEKRRPLTTSDKIQQAIRDGLNDAEIRKTLGVTQKQIDMSYMKKRGET